MKASFIATLPLLMGGCQSIDGEPDGQSAAEFELAILTQKTAAAHQELEETISQAMGGQKVTLATEVLMSESKVSVQQKQSMAPDGNPIEGRIMKRPDTFILQTDGKSCTLTHEQSGKSYPLSVVKCERAAP